MPEVEVELMGPLRVRRRGETVALPRSRKARGLLAMLALEPEGFARTTLCAHIWPETADPKADLRWSLSKLRGVLGDGAVLTTGDAVRLDFERVSTDVRRLEAWLEAPADPAAVDGLAEAERHFVPDPLGGVDLRIGVEFELWLESRRHGLRRLQQRVLAALVDWGRDEPARALEYARRRVLLDPLSEGATADLLELTLRTGGRRQAQTVLEQARDRLRQAGLPDAGLLAAWRRLSSGGPATAAHAEPTPGPALEPEVVWTPPQKPSVAVLAFDNLGSPEDATLAAGLCLEINASLARLRHLFVIAHASASRFRLTEASAPGIGRRLGVRYLVHGGVRRLAGRLRVTVDLIECERGEQVWSEHFDAPMDDLFVVEDRIVGAIVSALEPQIEQAERDRARMLPTENLNAWECFHRAMWHMYRFTSADNVAAHTLLSRAIEQDPGFARAHAGLSFSHFSRAFLNASDDVRRDIDVAVEHGRTSVGLEPRDALGHWSLGRALFLAGAHDQALGAIDRALVANPNYAQGHYARGFIGCHSGIPGEVMPDLDMAQRLSPFDPMLFAMESCRAITLAVMERPDEAVGWAVKATHEPNAHFHIPAIAAACLQLTGREEEARRHVAEAQRRHPGYCLRIFEQSFPYKSERDRRVLSEALLAAGIAR